MINWNVLENNDDDEEDRLYSLNTNKYKSSIDWNSLENENYFQKNFNNMISDPAKIKSNVSNILNTKKQEKPITQKISMIDSTSSMNEKDLTQQKYESEANTDTNLFSQIGKNIENIWLSLINSPSQAIRYSTDTERVAYPSLSGKPTSINKNTPKEVVLAYQAQDNNRNDDVSESSNELPKINLDGENSKTEQTNTQNIKQPVLYNLDVENNVNENLNNYKDAFGELELNPIQRELSKSIEKNEEKITSNVNQISNPILRKTAQLFPSVTNSLIGAGLSAFNPGLRYGLFYIECSRVL